MQDKENELSKTFCLLYNKFLEGQLEYNENIMEIVEIIEDITKGKDEEIIIDENISFQDLIYILKNYDNRRKGMYELGISFELEYEALRTSINISSDLIVFFSFLIINKSLKFQKHIREIILNSEENYITTKYFGNLKLIFKDKQKNLTDGMFDGEEEKIAELNR